MTHSYRCLKCNAKYDLLILPREKDTTKIECPQCLSTEYKELITSPPATYRFVDGRSLRM